MAGYLSSALAKPHPGVCRDSGRARTGQCVQGRGQDLVNVRRVPVHTFLRSQQFCGLLPNSSSVRLIFLPQIIQTVSDTNRTHNRLCLVPEPMSRHLLSWEPTSAGHRCTRTSLPLWPTLHTPTQRLLGHTSAEVNKALRLTAAYRRKADYYYSSCFLCKEQCSVL